MTRETFAVTGKGGVLLIPILGEHIGRTQTLTLRLWIDAGPAKTATATYTEAALDFALSITNSDDSLQIIFGDQTKRVNKGSKTGQTELSRFIDTFERSEFEEPTKGNYPNDAFSVQSYDPVHLQSNEMVLLHFTDK